MLIKIVDMFVKTITKLERQLTCLASATDACQGTWHDCQTQTWLTRPLDKKVEQGMTWQRNIDLIDKIKDLSPPLTWLSINPRLSKWKRFDKKQWDVRQEHSSCCQKTIDLTDKTQDLADQIKWPVQSKCLDNQITRERDWWQDWQGCQKNLTCWANKRPV